MKRYQTTPMSIQPARADQMFLIEGMRLMNGPEPTAEELAAAAAVKEAAEKAAAEKAAAEEAEKLAAEKAAEEAERKRIEDERKAGKLTDKEFELLTDAMKHKAAAREAQRQAAEALKAEAAANERLKVLEGVDVDQIKKLLADKAVAENAAREAELKAAQKAGDTERVKAMMAEQHKAELEKAKAEQAEKDRRIADQQKLIDELTLGSDFNSSKFVLEELTYTPADARKLYADYFDVVEGKVVPFDKPRGTAGRGELVNAQGQPMAFDDAMKRIIDAQPERDRLLRSKLAPGARSKTDLGARSQEKKDGELRGAARIQAGIAAGAFKKKA